MRPNKTWRKYASTPPAPNASMWQNAFNAETKANTAITAIMLSTYGSNILLLKRYCSSYKI